MPEALCGNRRHPGMLSISFLDNPPTSASVTRPFMENISGARSAAHPPSRLKSEPGGVSPVPAQRAEGPHDQFEARVVYVPQVDVFVRDLHGALSIDVQVRGGHQVHVETFWKTT